MDTKRNLEEIAALMEAILEETEIISNYPGKIPQIELDLVKENIRKLYEAYHQLDRDNAGVRNTDTSPKQSIKTPIPQAPPAEVLSKEIDVESAPAPIEPSPPPSPPSPKPDPKAEMHPEPEIDLPFPEPIAPVRSQPFPWQEPPKEEAPAEAPRITIPRRPSDIPLTHSIHVETSGNGEHDTRRLADRYKKEEKTLNDQVDSRNSYSVAERLQQNRITDLRAAMGINDKFLFINDLFQGDSDRYNQAIEALNTLAGMDEATIHLNHLQQQYGWDNGSPVFDKLRDFIRRRYL